MLIATSTNLKTFLLINGKTENITVFYEPSNPTTQIRGKR